MLGTGWPDAVCALRFWRRIQTARHLCEAIFLSRACPFFHSHPNHVDSFDSFDFFNFDIFNFVASSPENSATYDLVSLARVLPLPHV